MSVQYGGDKITFADGSSTSSGYTFRNRIINGAMVISQYNGTSSVSIDNTKNQYYIDRWAIQNNTGSAVFSYQQVTTAPTGFNNSLKITVTTADGSLTSTAKAQIYQPIEGYNIADLGWGTANAKSVTLSFWVQSSVTGTFGGALGNNANDRSYPFTYTISSANTWEQKSITIAGDTTGTWLTTNGLGINVDFSLGAGTSRSGTAGTWGGAWYTSATGATNLLATNGATFYITGIQFEVGSSSTTFEARDYGNELRMCQRYYQLCNGFLGTPGASTTIMYTSIQYQVAMRANPSLGQTGVINMTAPGVDTWQQSSTGIAAGGQNTTGTWIQLNNFSGLTQHRPYVQSVNYAGNGYVITLSAEL